MADFIQKLISTWWGITIISVIAVFLWFLLSALFYRQFFKRFYDIVLSGLALIILSPIILILIICITIGMKGNPFFIQERTGKKMKTVRVIKFRSMSNERNSEGELLPNNERITKFGAFIRKTSIDELPQLFNVFLGQMSIVGPRPLPIRYETLYNDIQLQRFKVRPGITGLAQVNGRNSLSWEEKFRFDIEYIEQYSWVFDCRLLFKTVISIIKKSNMSAAGDIHVGAFTGNKSSHEVITVDSNIELIPFSEEHIEQKVKWINDDKNNQYLHYEIPISVEKTKEWWQKKRNDKSRMDYIISYSGAVVGLIGLINIDAKNRNAEFHIILGENDYKRKGIAFRAINGLLEYAFTTLYLHKIFLYVDSDNVAARALYEKAGFKCEGILVDHLLRDNTMFIDRCIYSKIR